VHTADLIRFLNVPAGGASAAPAAHSLTRRWRRDWVGGNASTRAGDAGLGRYARPYTTVLPLTVGASSTTDRRSTTRPCNLSRFGPSPRRCAARWRCLIRIATVSAAVLQVMQTASAAL